MNDDKCKICNLTITSYDNVKVCPDCGECYHKSCYELNGCINPNCKKDNQVKKCSGCNSELANDAQFCTYCGKKVEIEANICKHCGNEYDPNSNFCPICGFNVNSHKNGDISLESVEAKTENNDLNDFIQDKSDYYKSKFKEMEVSKKKVTWNWCAFLFGQAWYIYRKMWIPAIIFLLINTGLTALDFYGLIGENFVLIIDMAIWVFNGMFGNYIYMQYVNNNLKKLKDLDEDQKFYYCKRKGGTSIGILIFFLIVGMVISSLFI